MTKVVAGATKRWAKAITTAHPTSSCDYEWDRASGCVSRSSYSAIGELEP